MVTCSTSALAVVAWVRGGPQALLVLGDSLATAGPSVLVRTRIGCRMLSRGIGDARIVRWVAAGIAFPNCTIMFSINAVADGMATSFSAKAVATNGVSAPTKLSVSADDKGVCRVAERCCARTERLRSPDVSYLRVGVPARGS